MKSNIKTTRSIEPNLQTRKFKESTQYAPRQVRPLSDMNRKKNSMQNA